MRALQIGVISRVPTVLLAWTLGRLALVPIIILSFGVSPALTLVTLVAFVVADLYDGVLARQLGADDPTRRILDSLVDRTAIWSVYGAVTIFGYLPPALLIALVARDVYCGYQCRKIVVNRNVVIRADWTYRSLNLLLAAWVVAAPLLQSQVRSSLFVSILAFAALIAFDLKLSVAAISKMPRSVTSKVIPARVARRAWQSPDRAIVFASPQ